MSTAASASFETPRKEVDSTCLASSSCSSSAPPKAAGGTPRKDGGIAKTKSPKVAPVKMNVPDLSKCYVCGKKFNIFKRRHTCHNCHEAVCKACAQYRKMLPAYTKPKRVCDLCIKNHWSKKNFDGETPKSDDCALSLTLPAADDTDSCREITSATSPKISAATVGAIGIGDVGITSARTLPPPTPVEGDDLGPTRPTSAVVRGQAGLGSFFGGRQEGSTSSGNKKLSEREGAISSSKLDVPAASSVVEKEEASRSSPSLPSIIHKEGFAALSTASSTSPAVTHEDGKVVDDVMGTTKTKAILPSPREGMGPDVATASPISVPADTNKRGESRDDGLRLDANEASTTDASLTVTNAMTSVEKSDSGNPQTFHIDHDEVDGDSMPTPVDKMVVDASNTSCSSAAIPDLAVKDSDASQADTVECIERTSETKAILPSPREGMGPDVATASSLSVPADTNKQGESRDDGLRLDANEASTTDPSLTVTNAIASVEKSGSGNPQALHIDHDEVDGDSMPTPVDKMVVDASNTSCSSAAIPDLAVKDPDASQADNVECIERTTETKVILPSPREGMGPDVATVSSISVPTDTNERGESRDDGLMLDANEASTDASLSLTVPIAINEEGEVDLSQALQKKHDNDVDDVLLPASPGAPLFPVLADVADASGAKCASAASPGATPESSDILRQGDKGGDASLAEEADVLPLARENGVGQESVALLPSTAETGDECGRAAHPAENSEEHTVGGSELPGQDCDGNAASDIRETEKGGSTRVARHGKDNAHVGWIFFCLVAVCMGLAVVFLLSRGGE